METPNLLRGTLYPSRTVSRCPRFHACIVTKKCQNFDTHRQDCRMCEARVTTKLNQPKDDVPLGGCLPEGEYQPDLQDAVKTIQDRRGVALFDPENSVTMERTVDISSKLGKLRRATDMQATMMKAGLFQITEEDIKNGTIDNETLDSMGRLE